MTYRLERRGVHVSGQCHGPAAKTVGEKESWRLLTVLSDRGLAPGLCHITLPPQQTTNEGCEEQTWGGGELEGRSTT